jgi:hypothetical protein
MNAKEEMAIINNTIDRCISKGVTFTIKRLLNNSNILSIPYEAIYPIHLVYNYKLLLYRYLNTPDEIRSLKENIHKYSVKTYEILSKS